MTATVPKGAGLFSRILAALIQVKRLGMAEKEKHHWIRLVRAKAGALATV